ncbi:glycosyltransferase family 4 protein [Bacillus piscicola]|uniref:glycosyltransferase family 4 protein n=1 Tax=Bacillus piscicola TaxID=1632684 RepID=UPI001F09164A|nr:glycosyltransferase family 4 protein [Bacillus piscicola]
MKDVLIISHFTQAPGEKGNGRFHYIAERVNNESAQVELVTTSFSHKTKMQRNVTKEQINSLSYKFTMLHEPGYKKNVSLRRFYSHYIMGKSLQKYMKSRNKPDVIYCSVPSLNVARVAAEFANKHRIKFIIDVQDLWPEAFRMVFNPPLICNMIFFPMQRNADYIYSSADEIIAVSETYCTRALKVNHKSIKAHSIFLGTELTSFDEMAKENKVKEKPKDEIWLSYIGTLGHSYDITSVIEALKVLKEQEIDNIKFIVMGDGPLKSKFEDYANKQGVYSEFTGRLDYRKMVGILNSCDIAVNPIKAGSAGSIINKVGDYAAAGLPVINTQESQEYRDLITEYNSGINCENSNVKELAEKILMLCKNKELRNRMGENHRKLATDMFDRQKTYNRIVDLLVE